MSDDEPIYVDRISPGERMALERLTQPRDWDYHRFRQVLISLGVLGNGAAIPAINRPDGILISGMRPFVDRLAGLAGKSGVEYAQAILVDREGGGLVMGKITHGDERGVAINPTGAPGKERTQVCVGSIHTHPPVFEVSHGFSRQDYLSFLKDRQSQVMVLSYGRDLILMAAKTSATPNNQRPESIEAQLAEIETDFLNQGTDLDLVRVVRFNKMVCLGYGLTLFTNGSGGDLMRRVEVTSLG